MSNEYKPLTVRRPINRSRARKEKSIHQGDDLQKKVHPEVPVVGLPWFRLFFTSRGSRLKDRPLDPPADQVTDGYWIPKGKT